MHVKDARKDGQLTLMGEGEVPTKDLLAQLHKLGYRGYVSLEWEKAWHPELADAQVAFPQAARYLSDLFKDIGIPRG